MPPRFSSVLSLCGFAPSRAIVVLGFLSLSGHVFADVRMPDIFSDHMVLAKSAKVPVWGKADPGEAVAVTLAKQTVRTEAGADGKWRVDLDLKNSPAGPFEMTVQGKNKIVIGDVVVGEVWLAGGQSNMELPMKRLVKSPEEVARSANLMLRQFEVRKRPALDPQEDCEGFWSVAGPGTTAEFGSTGYYFGKALQRELKVPVGIIKDCWGGTAVEPWTSAASIATVPELEAAAQPRRKLAMDNIAGLEAWMKKTGREDHPTTDIAAFATGPASTENGWVPVKSSGEVSAPGLPKYGAFWFRKDVTLPAVQMGTPQVLEFAPVVTFDRVYWNGTHLGETTSSDFSSDKSVRRYFIPPSLLKEGVNKLAVRIFAPAAPPAFSWPPHVGTTILEGNWMAKAEFELPLLEKGVTQPAPRLIPLQAVTSSLFNGMIRPVMPYAITGAIWYQGEANSKQAHAYRTAFPLLIKDWRQHWQQGDFPFYFCQLANFRPKKTVPGESDWAELREAQLMTLAVPNTGQAVLIDVGETADIHPQNKEVVGERLAKIALARTYGKPVAFSGPLYKSMKIDANKIRLSFTNVEGGLVAKELPPTQILKTQDGTTAPLVRNSPNSQVEGFAICGEDRKWVWADAKIDGDTVLVWSDSVPSPVAARYAWADNPTCNLYNKADLPASPFRTDDFPGITKQPPQTPVTGSR